MSSLPLNWVFLKQILTPKFAAFSLLFSLFFISLSIFLINIPNYISIATAPYSLFSKLNLFWILFIGSFQSVSGFDLFLLTIISILFGLNLGMVVKKYRFVRSQPNLGITLGSGIISLAAAGCASCGLSIVSLVGLGSALAILPFGGLELYVGAIIILSASLLYNLSALYKACKI